MSKVRAKNSSPELYVRRLLHRMSARSAYRLRAGDTLGSFSAAWETALEDGRRSALDTGIARAIEGETVPVYYRGRKVGEYVRFNNRLLIAALLASSSAARDAAGSLRNNTFAFTGPVR